MLGKHLKLIFVVSLVVLITAFILAVWGFPTIVRKQIQKNIQIDNSSMMFDKWRKTPMPLLFKIYVFNVTNPEEVNNGQRPKLSEVGPFVYENDLLVEVQSEVHLPNNNHVLIKRYHVPNGGMEKITFKVINEFREKTILGYGENDTVKYTLKKTFFFNSNESGALSEDDEVTVINFSYMAAILSVQEIIPSLVPMVNQALGEMFSNLTDPFLTVKVRDLLFDGIFMNCEGTSSALGLVCGKIRSDSPPTMRPSEDGKGFYFSMFSHMNRTESGPYEMVRGTKDMYGLGQIVSYKNKTSMKNWGDVYCGQLNGSDSSIFPPIDESAVPERLYTFEPEICRSVYASLVGKANIFNMTAYHYEISESVFAAKSAVPTNKCFCRRNWSAKHDGCLVMGLLNLLPCQGAPAIASLPHFYLASEEILEYFDGTIKPDKEKHNTFVYLDPVTGVILQGVRRFQFNIELRNVQGVPQLENVTTGLFPLLWMEESATLPSSIVEELQHSHAMLSYVEIIRWLLLAIGIVAVLGSAIMNARSGTIPFWPKQSNSVSFILRPGNFSPNDVNKVQ